MSIQAEPLPERKRRPQKTHADVPTGKLIDIVPLDGQWKNASLVCVAQRPQSRGFEPSAAR